MPGAAGSNGTRHARSGGNGESPTVGGENEPGPPIKVERTGYAKFIYSVILRYEEKSDRDKPAKMAALDPEIRDNVYNYVRQEIKREDDLVNQRNTWCILSSAALIAGIATIASKLVVPNLRLSPEIAITGAVLMVAFSVAGFLLSLFCCRAVVAARKQIEYLFEIYNDNRETFLQDGLFRPFGRLSAHRSGIGYSQMAPLIIMHIWVVVMLVSAALSAKILAQSL